jgi:hypothetical protein
MGRHILTGTLGLLLAVVWGMAFFYQRHNVDFLLAVMSADAPAALRVSSFWSLLQIWIPALLVLPVAEISVAMMFGARPLFRAYRVAVATSAVLSVGTLVSQAAFAAVRVSAGHPVFLPNPTINNELLIALVTLGLQLALLTLLRTSGNLDTRQGSSVSRGSDDRTKPGSTARSSHLNPRRASMPTSPLATRGDAGL